MTWNGTRNDDAPVKAPVYTPPVDKLTIALRRASTRFMDRPDHHRNCLGVHCLTHPVLFPAQEGKEFCLVRDYSLSSKWPHLLMCRQCTDMLQVVCDLGTVTTHLF